MADMVDSATRSRMMSGIRSTNTGPERLVRSLLHRNGFRFRLHVNTLPGKPDIVLPRYHAVIFVNGCFWHGHDCSLFHLPATKTAFWSKKIDANRARDSKHLEALKLAGWRTLTVWECAMKGKNRIAPEKLIQQISGWLHGNTVNHQIRGSGHGL
jgi:DNA mismatch endonuclease (patch repair protein)